MPGPTNKPPRQRSRAPTDPRAEPSAAKVEAASDTRSTARHRTAPRASDVSETPATLHRRVAALHAELADAQAQVARLEEEIANDAGRMGEMLSRVAASERETRAAEERAVLAERNAGGLAERVRTLDASSREEVEIFRARLADTQKWLEAERLQKEELREARDDERRRAEFAQTAQKKLLDRAVEELELERANVEDLKLTASGDGAEVVRLRAALAEAEETAAEIAEKTRTAVEVELLLSHDNALEKLRAQQATDLALLGEQHEAALVAERSSRETAVAELTSRLEAAEAKLVSERQTLAEILDGLSRSEVLVSNADEALADLEKKEQETQKARAKAFSAARKLIVTVEEMRRKGERSGV